MLVAEYDYDTDIAVQREEAGKIAFAKGISQGKSLGLAEGEVRGTHQKALETARILKQLGESVQKIMQATGLTVQEIEALN